MYASTCNCRLVHVLKVHANTNTTHIIKRPKKRQGSGLYDSSHSLGLVITGLCTWSTTASIACWLALFTHNHKPPPAVQEFYLESQNYERSQRSMSGGCTRLTASSRARNNPFETNEAEFNSYRIGFGASAEQLSCKTGDKVGGHSH